MTPKEPKEITEKFGFVGGNALQDILDKQPDAIAESERDILRARRSYLTDEQVERFGLDEKQAAAEGSEGRSPNLPAETKAEKKEREKAEKAAAKEAAKAAKDAEKDK